MEAEKSIKCLIEQVEQSYAAWNTALSQISPVEMVLPISEGGWTAKDMVAHITWHELEMIGVIRERALRGSDLWQHPTEVRNAAIFTQNRDRPLEDVQREAVEIHRELLAALQTLTDDDLVNASHFAEMPPDWLPWDVIASNTFEHYPEHRRDFEDWLKRRKSER